MLRPVKAMGRRLLRSPPQNGRTPRVQGVPEGMPRWGGMLREAQAGVEGRRKGQRKELA